jgi:serine/threonine protein kinase
MEPERWQQVKNILHSALEREPGQRGAYLARECGDDESLRREVEAFLAANDQAGSFFEMSAVRLAAEVVAEGGANVPRGKASVQIGQQLGSYQITSLLGKGGMGEVYRARDTKLKRDVAIKILSDEFSRDPDRVSRFQREAEVLASLNHPNIAAIYDLQEANGSRYLVLELVEGETLADRIARGPIPVEEALDIAKSICEALEAAHEKGIIHRDLKPANVKITDGKVKVLDFGLAKVMSSTAPATTLSNSPTLLTGTMGGAIVGTAAYMSPEQARGRNLDKRTDIWAFGVVLYEMLTGRMLFSAETASETIAAVMLKEPDWNMLPANIPARVRDLLRRCLVKEPRNRTRDIGDARIAIEKVQSGAEVDGDVPQVPAPRRRNVLIGIAAVFFLTTVFFAALSSVYRNRPEPPEMRLEVNVPPRTDPPSFAISPDGRRLVYLASNEGKSQLWVRPLDSVAAQPLPGTDGARLPFWSPDSASIGFFADGKLKRIDIVGGGPQVLANDVGGGNGGTWNREGIILFSNGHGGLLKVDARGGEPVEVTGLETGQYPEFFPDGHHFIYFGRPSPGAEGIYVGSLDGGSSKRLTNADTAAVVSPSGFLLFHRQTNLFAQAFDFQRQELSGNPFPVAEGVARDAAGRAAILSAASGIVAYRTERAGTRQLTWLDRSGKSVGAIGAPDTADLSQVEPSPDGKRIAVVRVVNGNVDVWLIDAARGIPTRFTFDAAADRYPVWSPDGNRIVFQANRRKGPLNLYWKLSNRDGAEDELLLESNQPKAPVDWSPDGHFLLFRSGDLQTGSDLWILPVHGNKKPVPFLKTPFEERNGQFSPDGKWVAYESNESGRFEIYVQPFPGPGRKVPISSNGGAQPRWNKNGKEIFYVSLDSKLTAAPVKVSPDGESIESGTPATLFPVRIPGGPVTAFGRQEYAVSSDGQRFLVNLAADEAASPITLIYNWHPEHQK